MFSLTNITNGFICTKEIELKLNQQDMNKPQFLNGTPSELCIIPSKLNEY